MDSDIKSAKTKSQAENTQRETKAFRTPEEVAAEQTLKAPLETTGEDMPQPSKPAKPTSSWKQKLTLHWPPGKKEWIIFLVILLLVVGGGIGWALTHKKPATLKPIPKVTAKTVTVPSTLTGLPVDPSVNQRTVTGVMIENSVDARPQSGLGQAGVVFEAIAEGGITRFPALYAAPGHTTSNGSSVLTPATPMSAAARKPWPTLNLGEYAIWTSSPTPALTTVSAAGRHRTTFTRPSPR
jgi:hypothetical protein